MLTVYTDGSCLGNPGLGGMGIVVIHGDEVIMELGIPSGEITTNNRMELGAVTYIIRKLLDNEFTEMHIVTDSNYVVKGATEWIGGWKKKNFKNVKNDDLWCDMAYLLDEVTVSFQWVKGHNKHQFNEMADRVAVEAATTQQFIQR